MENQDKTFELNLEPYTIKGIISPLTDDEIEDIENIEQPKEYSGCIFNLSIISQPQMDIEIFNPDKTILAIYQYNGKEIALGILENSSFKELTDDSLIFRTISVRILELILINGSGHFKSN